MLDKTIHDYWMRELQSGENYELYLHSPFCVKPCKYCVYTGKCISDKDYRDVYDKYVNAYLPEAIANYDDIFSIKPASSFYFGGGTPNLIRPEDLFNIFERIKNFDKIPYKLIDIHPAYLNDRFLDALASYGFTTLCFGVQSFNKDTLDKNNRAHVTPEKLKEWVDKAKKYGMYTSIDLMCYLDSYTVRDIDTLKSDLDMATKMDLDFIAVNPNLHFILSDRKYGDIFESFMDEYLLIGTDEYVSEKEIFDTDSLNERMIYRIVNKKVKNEYKYNVLPYFADDFPYADNNIIGIGDLSNRHATMSYIHHKLFYVERNVDFKPVYDIQYIKQESHVDRLAQMVDYIRKKKVQ